MKNEIFNYTFHILRNISNPAYEVETSPKKAKKKRYCKFSNKTALGEWGYVFCLLNSSHHGDRRKEQDFRPN